MTNFGWWQAHANDQGMFLCMICFEAFPLDETYVDEEGRKWDICVPCQRSEEEAKRRRDDELGWPK